LETDALESALQQSVKDLHTKQQQLADEQKQVNSAVVIVSTYLL